MNNALLRTGSEKVRFFARLGYDGEPFHGFAVNRDVRTVAGDLEEALATILQEEVTVVCAGRTDAGVHALGQVIHFDTTNRQVPAQRIHKSLNGLCKPDIVVYELGETSADFDARHSCIARRYNYRVLNSKFPDPFRRKHTWHIHQPLDIQAMNQAGQHLLGTHDFSTFCKAQTIEIDGVTHIKPRTRDLTNLQWQASTTYPGEIHLHIAASSFCHQMVRSIAGVCVHVGLGKMPPERVPDLLAAKDRKVLARVAPGHGLFLVEASYSRPPSQWLN